jgi:hypothetical protein
MKVDNLINRLKEVNRKKIIEDNTISDDFKKETLHNLIVKEFNKKYYNL